MYAVTHGTFRTPRGQNVSLAYREDTNDWNTLTSCLTEDEYRLRDLYLGGTALDVGAHIGGVSIALAVDNPELQVVAVEAVPPNVELLRQNLAELGLSERVTVIHAAAGKGKQTTIRWAFAGNEAADHHAFIGNAILPTTDLSTHASTLVDVRSLASLVKQYGPFSFAKVDCELCEFDFLSGAGLKGLGLIRGEVHADPAPLAAALAATHTTTMPTVIPGGFEAVAR